MMVTFNSLQLMMLISNFFWPLVRILSFFSTAPIFSNKSVSRKSKIILSGAITWLIFPFLPAVHITFSSPLSLLVFFQQILIGITLGLTAQFLFATVNLAGEIMGLQIGLSFATFFNNNNHIGVSIISRFLNFLTLFFFLALNAHLYLIFILVNSFYSMPIDSYFFKINIFFALLKFFSHVFFNSIILILPVIMLLLALSIIMSLLNRLSPQISIFSIGFPLNLLIGILMLYSLTSFLFPFFKTILNQLVSFMFHIFLKS